MCLSSVSKRKPKPDGSGWKIFLEQEDGTLLSRYFDTYTLPVDVWLDEKDFRMVLSHDWIERQKRIRKKGIESYRCGWHIFKKEKSAKFWNRRENKVFVLRKVEYRDAHTQGTEINDIIPDCIVAKEIKILPEENK